MRTFAKQFLEYAAGLPEGTPLVAKELLHLENRSAVDQVLSRLARRGALLRAGHGIYVLAVEGRFGVWDPSPAKMVDGLARQRGETIVSHGKAAANALGLTTQVPIRSVYLTSGPSRRLKMGPGCRVQARAGMAADFSWSRCRRCGAGAGVAGT